MPYISHTSRSNQLALEKRLDTDGNYQVELEEDYQILDAMSQVQSIVIANEGKCI